MPIYLLGKDPVFPPAEMATKEGIIAVGGDLSVKRLINAYSQGIFPWYSEGDPIIWWSPDPRLVLFPEELHVSKSIKKILRKDLFRITYDTDFKEIIKKCQRLRENQDETWITDDMRDAYIKLHEAGYAHSVEVWKGDELAGGLYGVSLGKCFFGESMFFDVSNASKFGLIKFVQKLQELEFLVIDCQVKTKHLESLGAREIPRAEFLSILKKGLEYKTISGKWAF